MNDDWSRALEELRRSLAAVVSGSFGEASEEELAATLVALESVSRTVHAASCAVSAEVARSNHI